MPITTTLKLDEFPQFNSLSLGKHLPNANDIESHLKRINELCVTFEALSFTRHHRNENRKLFVEKAKNHKEKLISLQGADWEGVKESVIKPLFSVQGLDYLILLEHDLKAYRDEDRGQTATTHYILSREQYLKIKKAIPEDKLLLSFDTAADLIQKIKILEELTDIFEYYLLIEEKVTFNIPILGRFYKNKAQKEFFTRLREFQSTLNLEHQKQSIAHYMGCILNTVHRLQDGTIDDNVVEVVQDLLKAVEKSDRIVTKAVTPKKTPSSKGNIFERITEFALSIIGKIKEVLGTEELTLETKEYKPATYNKFQKFFKGKKHLFYNHGMDSETFRFLHKYIFKYAAESDVEQLKSLLWFQPGPQNLIEVIPVQKKEFLLAPLPLKNYTLSFKKDSKNYSRYKFIKSTFYNLTFINFIFQNLPKEIAKIDTLEEFTIGRERFLYTLNQIEAIYDNILIIEAGLSNTKPPLDSAFKDAYLKVLQDAKRKLLSEAFKLISRLNQVLQTDFRKNYPYSLSKVYDEPLLKQLNKFLQKIEENTKNFEKDSSLLAPLSEFKLATTKIKELLSYQCVPYSLNEDVEIRINKDFETLALNKYENNKSIHMLQWINDLLNINFNDVDEFFKAYDACLKTLDFDEKKYWLLVENRVLKKLSLQITDEQDLYYQSVVVLNDKLAISSLKEIIKQKINFKDPASIMDLIKGYIQHNKMSSLSLSLEIVYEEVVRQFQCRQENFSFLNKIKMELLPLVFNNFDAESVIYQKYEFLKKVFADYEPLRSKFKTLLSDLVLGTNLRAPLTHEDLINLKTFASLLAQELNTAKEHAETLKPSQKTFLSNLLSFLESTQEFQKNIIEVLLALQKQVTSTSVETNQNDTEAQENSFLHELQEYTKKLENRTLQKEDLFSLFISYNLAVGKKDENFKPFINAFNTYFYFVLGHIKNVFNISVKEKTHQNINFHQNEIVLAFIESLANTHQSCFNELKEKLKAHQKNWLNCLKFTYALNSIFDISLNVSEDYILSCLKLAKDPDFSFKISSKEERQEEAQAFLNKEGVGTLIFMLDTLKQNFSTLIKNDNIPKSILNLGIISIPLNTSHKYEAALKEIEEVISSLKTLKLDDFGEALKAVKMLSSSLKNLNTPSVMDSLEFLKVIEKVCELKPQYTKTC